MSAEITYLRPNGSEQTPENFRSHLLENSKSKTEEVGSHRRLELGSPEIDTVISLIEVVAEERFHKRDKSDRCVTVLDWLYRLGISEHLITVIGYGPQDCENSFDFFHNMFTDAQKSNALLVSEIIQTERERTFPQHYQSPKNNIINLPLKSGENIIR